MHTIETLLTRATGRLESIVVGIIDEVQSQSLAVELQTSQGRHRYLLRESGVSSEIDRWPEQLTQYVVNDIDDQLFLKNVAQERFSGADEVLVVLKASSKHEHLLIQGEWSSGALIQVGSGIEDGGTEDKTYRHLFVMQASPQLIL
jgi:hypothetical protein